MIGIDRHGKSVGKFNISFKWNNKIWNSEWNEMWNKVIILQKVRIFFSSEKSLLAAIWIGGRYGFTLEVSEFHHSTTSL